MATVSTQAYATPPSAMAAVQVQGPDPLADVFLGEKGIPWKLNTKNTTKLRLYPTALKQGKQFV